MKNIPIFLTFSFILILFLSCGQVQEKQDRVHKDTFLHVNNNSDSSVTNKENRFLNADDLLQLKWKSDLFFNALPILYKGVIYTSGYALDAKSGKIIWVQRLLGSAEKDVVVDDSIVCITSSDSYDGVGIKGGKIMWTIDAAKHSAFTPCHDDNNIYLINNDSCYYAVDPLSGKEKWKFSAAGRLYYTGLVYNGIVYIGGTKFLHGIDTKTGKQVWSFPLSHKIAVNPVLENGILYFIEEAKMLYAMDLQNHTIKWKMPVKKFVKQPVIDEKLIYVDGSDFCARDKMNGQVIWCADQMYPDTQPYIFRNYIVFHRAIGDEGPPLFTIVDKYTGKKLGEGFKSELQTTLFEFGADTTKDNIIYAVGSNKSLYAFKLKK